MVDTRNTRRLSAILAADVAEYSRLMHADEAGTITAWQAARREAIDPTLAHHDGHVVKRTGDGVLAEFSTVENAVRCAVALQEALAGNSLNFRMGIHLGDITDDGDDIHGDGVNIAARLEGLAEPGGICISGDVFNQVQNKLNLAFTDTGEQEVKNIARPIRVYRLELGEAATKGTLSRETASPKTNITIAVSIIAVIAAIAGLFVWQPWTVRNTSPVAEKMAAPSQKKPSIAVLPFNNMSGDVEQEYFSDGITEDLITDLSKISGLIVIARNSTFAYKGKSPDIRDVGRELGVRFVLEGSVRKAGGQVRINAQLIDAETGAHLWAERYDGSLDDVFGLQDKVTAKIITVLAVQLTKGEQKRIARKETENAEAYNIFLKGWEQYQRQRPQSFRKAIVLFEKAAVLDPNYSRANAALAAIYWQAWKRHWHNKVGVHNIHIARVKAEDYLAKAMRNPTPLSRQVSAAMLAQRGHHSDAITEGERAIALDPNDAEGFATLAGAFTLAGRPQEALPLIERAVRLNPHFPASYLYELGLARFSLGEFDLAATALEKAVALNPDDRWSSRILIATLGYLGRGKDAEALMDNAENNWRGFDPLSVRGVAFWYPFKRPADTERLAEGLRKAGVPD